jgi:aspartate carbamoyltransferase catalytic subunit
MKHISSFATAAGTALAEPVEASVVNAGDGAHEHPTQGLSICPAASGGALQRQEGRCRRRRAQPVARSNIHGLVAMGVDVVVVRSSHLIPIDIERLGVTVETDLRKALEDADAVNVLVFRRSARRRSSHIDEYARGA